MLFSSLIGVPVILAVSVMIVGGKFVQAEARDRAFRNRNHCFELREGCRAPLGARPMIGRREAAEEVLPASPPWGFSPENQV